ETGVVVVYIIDGVVQRIGTFRFLIRSSLKRMVSSSSSSSSLSLSTRRTISSVVTTTTSPATRYVRRKGLRKAVPDPMATQNQSPGRRLNLQPGTTGRGLGSRTSAAVSTGADGLILTPVEGRGVGEVLLQSSCMTTKNAHIHDFAARNSQQVNEWAAKKRAKMERAKEVRESRLVDKKECTFRPNLSKSKRSRQREQYRVGGIAAATPMSSAA
ncbi:unnamed protein product, partial [Amoebophrya sp. A120]